MTLSTEQREHLYPDYSITVIDSTVSVSINVSFCFETTVIKPRVDSEMRLLLFFDDIMFDNEISEGEFNFIAFF